MLHWTLLGVSVANASQYQLSLDQKSMVVEGQGEAHIVMQNLHVPDCHATKSSSSNL